MNKLAKIAAIDEYLEHEKELSCVMGKCPDVDDSLRLAIIHMSTTCLSFLESMVGDDYGLINWYIHQNDYGNNEKELEYYGEKRKIKNTQDLVWAIERTIKNEGGIEK